MRSVEDRYGTRTLDMCVFGTVRFVSCWEDCVKGTDARVIVLGLRRLVAVSRTAVYRGT